MHIYIQIKTNLLNQKVAPKGPQYVQGKPSTLKVDCDDDDTQEMR